MTRRSGITLIEVLVSIFIMAIGLLALLALFPVGMLRMAQAIRDSRTALSGQDAQSLCNLQDFRDDPVVISDIPTGGLNPDFFNNPGQPGLPNADPYGESYAVLVDPIGYLATAGLSSQDWIGGVPGYLRRRPVSLALGNPTNVYKNFTLWDDMAFDGFGATGPVGSPQLSPAGSLVKRDTRYSWAYLFRRPQTQDKSIVDCSVVVFDQRLLSLTGGLTLEEYIYSGTTGAGNPVTTFNPSNNTIAIDYSSSPVPPPLRPGDWILDATFYQRTPNGQGIILENRGNPAPTSMNAYFYRVVATEELGNSVARYEVQNPIRGYPAQFNPGGYQGTAVVIRGIAEVFDKGPARLP